MISVNIDSPMASVTIFLVIFRIVSCLKTVSKLELGNFGADQRSHENEERERHNSINAPEDNTIAINGVLTQLNTAQLQQIDR